MFVQKKRAVIPKNYSEQKHANNSLRSNNRRNPISQLKGEIKIKAERITNLKKAMLVMNQYIDKRKVQDIDEDDLKEFENLFDDDIVGEREIEPVQVAEPEEPDDVVIVGVEEERDGRNVFRVGVEPLEVDRNLSLQYTYSTDVNIKINLKLNFFEL